MANKSISERLQNSIVIYSALGILVIGVIIASMSIIPLFNRLKKDQDRNLLFAVKTRTLIVEEYLSRAKDVALQVTSRTKAREKLEAYNKSEVSRDEFVNFSEGILVDALQKSKEVEGISRLDRKGNLVVQVGLPIPEKLWPVPHEGSREVLIYGPVTLGSESYLVVGAPILDRQSRRVGTDIILFKTTRLQQIVEDYTGLGETGETVLGAAGDDRVQLFFPLRGNKGGAPEGFPKNSPLGLAFEKSFRKEAGILKSSDSPEVIAYGPIQNSKWGIIVKMNKGELYAPVNRQVVVIGSIIVVLILLGTSGMVVLLRPLAGKMIIHTEELQREIQEKTAALQAELSAHKRTEEALEIQVRERTSELIEAIEKLKKEIAERKRAEEEIRRAAEEWSLTFDSITDLVSIQDRDFSLVRVNKAFAEVFKKKPEELIGKHCYEVVHGTKEPWPDCPHKEALETKKPVRKEFFEPNLAIYLEVSSLPIFNKKGEVVSAVHIASDITERKLLQEQLIQSEKLAAVGELISGVAHEINNPLTGIIGFAQLLKEEASGLNKDEQKQLELIYSEALRVKKIVSNLLSFARKQKPEKKPADINSVVEIVLDMRGYELRIDNISVNKEFEEELPRVEVDVQQMEQVFLNIINNAHQAMSEAHGKGNLTIRTYTKGDMVRIEFIDDGPGISKKNLTKIFNPFFTTKGVGKGTGLGLSVSYGIIKEHNGNIFAESEEGKGAKFIIELPIMVPPLPR